MNSDLETDLRLADKYGFDCIEIRLDKLEQYLRNHSTEALLETLSRHTIRPHAVNAVKDFNMVSEEQTEQSRRRVEWACSMAARIGSPCVVLVPTVQPGLRTRHEVETIRADCVRNLRLMASIASSYDVGIALEPMGYSDSTVRSLDEAWQIVAEVDHPNVGIVVDMFNLFLFDGWSDLSSLQNLSADRISVVHVADCEKPLPSVVDQHNRVWPGDGIIPIPAIVETLREIGYTGLMSVELFRPEYWKLDPDTTIRIAKQKLEECLGRRVP